MSTVVPSAARTTTGNSGAISLPTQYQNGAITPVETLALSVDATAFSGTPSVVISVEWSPDGLRFFPAETPDAMTAITGVTKVCKAFVIKGPIYRIVWTITGTTPSLTFQIDDYATT